jgi:hypothetical protein
MISQRPQARELYAEKLKKDAEKFIQEFQAASKYSMAATAPTSPMARRTPRSQG